MIDQHPDCLYENTANYSTLLHQSPITGNWHGYVDISYDNLDCVDDIDISYDDYCISEFEYEPVFSLIGTFGTCVYGSPYLTIDSSQSRLWNLDQIDGSTDNLYNYYDYSSDDSGIDVYILDSGIRTTHQEFDGINAGNHDWGFSQASINSAHGTHVAGTAAGRNVGIHKKVKNIYSFAVCRGGFLGCFGQDIESGLEMVARNLEKEPTKRRRIVINMSWGGTSGGSDYLNDIFEAIYDRGGIMVAAAGNSAQDACSFWPASLEWVISVGAHNSSNDVTYFSNYGSCVDIYAPGQDIISAVTDCDYCYAAYSGTSMASPAVTGLVANLLSVDNGLTFEDVKDIVTDTSNSFVLSNCPNADGDGECRGIKLDCNTIEGYENTGNAIETTSSPDDCSSDSDYYDCAVLEDLPDTLNMNVNGVYKNTGECYNGKAVYKATIDDIGDNYLFFSGSWWYNNYIWCRRFEDDSFGQYCQAYMSGRSTFADTSNYCNYYTYRDITFTDDVYGSAGTAYASLTGSNSDSVCGASNSNNGGGDDDDDDDSNGDLSECDYYDCIQTDKYDDDDFDTYWLPIGCLNSEAYYATTINSDTYYIFWDTSGEGGEAWYISNDLGNTDESSSSIDNIYYCDGKDDLKDCGKGKWYYYDSSNGNYEEDKDGKIKEKDTDDCEDVVVSGGFGVMMQSVSYSGVTGNGNSGTSTDNGGRGSTSDSDSSNDGSVEWWGWLLIVAVIVLTLLLIGVTVYYSKRIKHLEQNPMQNDANYRLMSNETS